MAVGDSLARIVGVEVDFDRLFRRHQDRVLAGASTVVVDDLECVPVQVDRVEHLGFIDHSHPHPLVALDADPSFVGSYSLPLNGHL